MTRVITAGQDGTAKIWNSSTGECLHTLSCPSPINEYNVCSAAFSADGSRVVTGTYAGLTGAGSPVTIWDSSTGVRELTLAGHYWGVSWAVYSADGDRIVTAADDKTAKIWNSSTGQCELTLRGHTEAINTCEFSPIADLAF